MSDVFITNKSAKSASDTSGVILDVSEAAGDELKSQQFADKKHLQIAVFRTETPAAPSGSGAHYPKC